jgi:hypothetical protein
MLHAQTQINSCNIQFTDNGGVASNYLNNENTDWLICPDDDSQFLTLTFTHIDIEVADNPGTYGTGCHDVLYIYDGKNNMAPLIGSFCGEDSGSGKSSFIKDNTLHVDDYFRPKNAEGCFYIQFISDQTNTLSGWEAEITCCTPTLDNGLTDGIDAPIANNYGNTFDLIIDNSCTRLGTLDNFTSFESSEGSCMTKGLTFENQAFYAFTSNSNGGFVEFEIDAIDSVGIIEMIVFGPVTQDTAGNYIGGVINDCVTGKDPVSLFFNAGPNQTYILGLATEMAGRTNFVTLPLTVGLGAVLPVIMTNYRISTKEDEITLTWSTSYEVNNDRFEIYRSFNGRQFEKIGITKAGEYSYSGDTYTFVDRPNTSGSIYYYISQIDLDENATDYAILKATLSKSKQAFSTFPNPSYDGRFSIILDPEILESEARIELFDALGKQVISEKLDNTTTFNFQDLKSGIYTIRIIGGATMLTHQHMIY